MILPYPCPFTVTRCRQLHGDTRIDDQGPFQCAYLCGHYFADHLVNNQYTCDRVPVGPPRTCARSRVEMRLSQPPPQEVVLAIGKAYSSHIPLRSTQDGRTWMLVRLHGVEPWSLNGRQLYRQHLQDPTTTSCM